jgi:hypothetical protein
MLAFETKKNVGCPEMSEPGPGKPKFLATGLCRRKKPVQRMSSTTVDSGETFSDKPVHLGFHDARGINVKCD